MIDKQHTARGADRDSARLGWAGAGLGVDGQVSARGLGSSRGLSTARTGLPHNGGEINPAARHEEARKKFDEDASNKLMRVIEKKKMDNLKVRVTFSCECVFVCNAVNLLRNALYRSDV